MRIKIQGIVSMTYDIMVIIGGLVVVVFSIIALTGFDKAGSISLGCLILFALIALIILMILS